VNPVEANVHSFVIKIQCQWTGKQPPRATWRGYITHIPDGERRYFKEPDDIALFIVPYLERMGIQVSVRWRIQQWLSRWKQRTERSR
jgi:hypothetical protein